jgi:hypothetical protein
VVQSRKKRVAAPPELRKNNEIDRFGDSVDAEALSSSLIIPSPALANRFDGRNAFLSHAENETGENLGFPPDLLG